MNLKLARPLAALPLFCVLPFLGAQVAQTERISPAAIERHIGYLASEELEGRDSGTHGGDLAEAYVEKELRNAGLDAVEAREFEFVAGVRQGPGSRFAIGDHDVAADSFRPYAFSSSGSGEWPAVLAGYGIEAPELGCDDYAGCDVKGKAVVVLAGSPEGDSPHGKFAAHAAARAKALLAAKKGATALVVIHSPIGGGSPHGDAKDGGPGGAAAKLPVFDGEGITRDAGIPAVAVLESAAGPLLGIDVGEVRRSLRQAEPHDAAGDAPKAGEAPPAAPAAPHGDVRDLKRTVRLTTDVTLERRKARNVLGWLDAHAPGAKRELVVVGAHHDHLGRGTTSSRSHERLGEIHPGADDNASGVAGVIELARALHARAGELRRPVLFVTFGAEERGLLGSKKLCEDLPKRIPGEPAGREPLRPVAMINLDMVGRLHDDKLMASGEATSEAWPGILEAARKRTEASGLPALRIAADNKEDLFGSSDHLSFYGAGMPVIFFFTGTHREYHTPDDTLYKKREEGKPRELLINTEGEARVLALVEEVAVETASRPEPPPYTPNLDLAPRMTFKVVLRLMPDYGADVEGMRVAEVSPGGPAAAAGLRSGDVIVKFGDLAVRSVQDYMTGLNRVKAGQKVDVEFVRAGKRQTASVMPLSLPQER